MLPQHLPPQNDDVTHSPYRTPWWPQQTREPSVGDGDIMAVFLVFWVASVVRVCGAVLRQEVMGAESSLAALAVLLTPRLLSESLRGLLSNVWTDRL